MTQIRKERIRMETLKCAFCGGSNYIQEDGYLICQHCHAKRAIETNENTATIAQRTVNPQGFGSLIVDDTFAITGNGVVVVGKIARGSFCKGGKVIIKKASGELLESTIGGIEIFMKPVDTASAGDNVGLLLSGVDKRDVQKGDSIERA
jgi:elongation factor Tu